MTSAAGPLDDPRSHTAKIREMLEAVARHAREDVEKVSDARAQALFETTAEVLDGLSTAYRHFDAGAELAWRNSARND